MPRIRQYNSNAARQAEYRRAIKLDMTVPKYRAYIAGGGKDAPWKTNNGLDLLWVARARKAQMHGDKACHGCGYKECACAEIAKHYPEYAAVTPPVRRKTHIVSPKPDCAKYVTACGKFQEDVQMTTDISLVTCSKCRTNLLAYKVTPPDTHIFTGNAVMTPLCLMRAGKRAKRGEQYVRTKGCPPTCKACLAAIAASIIPEDQPEVTSPVPQVQKQPVTPPEPVTKPIAVKPKDHSRVPAVGEL